MDMTLAPDPTLTAVAAIARERDDLLTGLRQSLAQSRKLDAIGPHGGGEDEANYALAWQVLRLVTGDALAATHCHELFADLERWIRKAGVDGYEPEAEAHHGTEPFLLFLPRYARLFDNPAAVSLVRGAADFIGNWVPGQPTWYDEARDVFVSWDLGSRVADRDPRHREERGDHWRFLHMALSAHALTGADRYAEWALRYGRARARRVLDAPDPLPERWDLDGRPIPLEAPAGEHHVAADPLRGVEQLLASGGVHALADLHALDPDPVFRAAAARVVATLLDQLGDPYADPAAAAVRRFRLGFADDRFDARLRADIGRWCIDDQPEHVVLPPRALRSDHGPGVGRRKDMQRWYREDGDGALRPSALACPAAATLAWDLTGELVYPLHALRVARRRTAVALRGLRSGREHADKGCSIASVMAGHGRNWGIGAVTGCLQQLLVGGDVVNGLLDPAVTVSLGNPEVVHLVRSQPGGNEMHLWNLGESTATVAITHSGESQTVALEPRHRHSQRLTA